MEFSKSAGRRSVIRWTTVPNFKIHRHCFFVYGIIRLFSDEHLSVTVSDMCIYMYIGNVDGSNRLLKPIPVRAPSVITTGKYETVRNPKVIVGDPQYTVYCVSNEVRAKSKHHKPPKSNDMNPQHVCTFETGRDGPNTLPESANGQCRRDRRQVTAFYCIRLCTDVSTRRYEAAENVLLVLRHAFKIERGTRCRAKCEVVYVEKRPGNGAENFREVTRWLGMKKPLSRGRHANRDHNN